MVEFAYNNSKQASTGHTPFYLNSGQHPSTPVTLALAQQNRVTSKVPSALDFVGKMDKATKEAKTSILASQQRQKAYADAHRSELLFNVGDKVWLETSRLRPEVARKLAKKREGPCPIIEKISSVTYKLKLPKRLSKVYPVFHVSALSPVREDPARPIKQKDPGPLFELKGEKFYEPESIVKKRKFRGAIQYRVHWKDYPDYENSWEPASKLSRDCPELIEEYEAVLAKRPSSRRKTSS